MRDCLSDAQVRGGHVGVSRVVVLLGIKSFVVRSHMNCIYSVLK